MHVSQRRNDDGELSFRLRDNSRENHISGPLSTVGFLLQLRLLATRDMKAIIYHNPKCGTSRKTLEILNQAGVDVEINEYLTTRPRREELQRLYARAGISPREGLRAKEPLAAELGLTKADASDDEILDAMAAHPILINRPLVETDKGVRLCRPQEVVRDIL